MKPEKYGVQIKKFRDPTTEKSKLYEFKMALFDKNKLEEVLLFVRNFQITIKALEDSAASAEIH